jgi:hypothetical protein
MSRNGSFFGELRQPRGIMVLICCAAIWLKLALVVMSRIPNAPYPHNNQNTLGFLLRTVIERAPHF